MPLLVINEEPVSEKHVCWFVVRSDYKSREISLYEVRECYYRHPDASDVGLVMCVESFFIDRADEQDEKASTWILMEANQKAITQARR